MEWLALDAQLEAKKKAKLRRQQRELKHQQREREEHERQQRKLDARCAEMHAEELLSVAMARLYAHEEQRKALESKREADMKMFRDVDRARKRAQALGLPLSTPGLTGPERLQALEARIVEKEAALQRAAAATQRLDALPRKRSTLRRLMTQYMASSLVKKVERAVAEQQCERLLGLFDPVSQTPDNRAEALLNHESANGFTPVLASIFAKKHSVLRRLLEIGASPNFESSWGMTPLLACVASDSIVAVNMLLLEFKADVHYETAHHVRAVHVAAEKGRIEVLKLLLRSGADASCPTDGGSRKTPLMQAVLANQFEAVKVLLAFGADRDTRDASGRSAADWAARLAYPHIASLLGSTVPTAQLHTQLVSEEEEMQESITGVCVTRLASQRRVLMLETAMRDRDVRRLRELLDDPMCSANYEDTRGHSPFLVLCRAGSCDDVLFALDRHALPLQQNRDGTNALIAASFDGKRELLELLLHAGGDLSTRDFRGWDSYRHLNHHDHADVVAALTETRRSVTHARPRVFTLGEPLPDTAMLRTRSIAVAPSMLQLIPSTSTVSEPEASSRPDTAASARATGRPSIGGSNHESDSEHERKSSNDSSDSDEAELALDSAEHAARRKWHTQQRVLKLNRARRAVFDDERTRILETATRGRRNGLVAPLPGDPSGRSKRPLCDNCRCVRAQKRCVECAQVLCDKCHARLHELAQRRHHTFTPVEPQMYVGSELKDVVQVHRDHSLAHSVAKSKHLIASMRELLLGNAAAYSLDSHSASRSRSEQQDPEVERFERSKRLAREKQVMQMPLNVPVAAAKRAACSGDGAIYANPAELELANLYITQRRFEKANELLAHMQQLVSDSLGLLHPTALKIAMAFARVHKETGHAAACVETMQGALALFESVLPADDQDVLLGVSVLLAGLDEQARYDDAVRVCCHWLELRRLSLGSDHSAVHAMRAQLDEFVAKRETIGMTDEDRVYLALLEQNAERTANALRDKERRLAAFRHLLLDDPLELADFLVFCRRDFADDLVAFWIAVEGFKQNKLDAKAFRAAAVHIFLTYIKSRRVKVVTAVQRKRIKKTITTPGRRLPATVYDEVQKVVFDVVYTGVYARFLATDHANKSARE